MYVIVASIVFLVLVYSLIGFMRSALNKETFLRGSIFSSHTRKIMTSVA
jgi:hypothetical protein